MRKVELRMNEEKKYKVIKKLVETNGNKKRAAIELGVTVRQINRMIAGYNAFGKEFFVHGNRARQPVHTLSLELKQEIVDLFVSKYSDCSYRFFTELLQIHENINVSESAVRKLLIEECLVSPKCHRKTKRRIKSELEQMNLLLLLKKMLKEFKQILLLLKMLTLLNLDLPTLVKSFSLMLACIRGLAILNLVYTLLLTILLVELLVHILTGRKLFSVITKLLSNF